MDRRTIVRNMMARENRTDRRNMLTLHVFRWSRQLGQMPVALAALIVQKVFDMHDGARRARRALRREFLRASTMSWILWDLSNQWYDWWDSIQQWWMAKLPGRYLTPYQHHNPIARSIRYRWAGGNWTLNQVLRAELRRRKMTHRQMVQQPGLPGTFINSYGLQQYDD